MQLSLVTLTSSEILNLSTTPVEVVAAPGNGFYVVPIFILLRSRAGSNPYLNILADLTLLMNNVSILVASMSGNILGTSYDSVAFYTPPSSTSALEVSDLDNQPILIKNTSPLLPFLGGDGTLEVQILYEVINV